MLTLTILIYQYYSLKPLGCKGSELQKSLIHLMDKAELSVYLFECVIL